ncbi:MAG: AzlD domain-containing protein [Chloroflexi bacterium]|nr:AzlD domain-containing protein [Chloroflexota bacterium]
MIWLTILGMGVVTYGVRVLPFTFLREEMLPNWVRRGLNYVPVAVLSAIIAPEYLPSEKWGHFTLDAHLLAGIAAIVAARVTKNTILTIFVGVAVLLILR